MSFSSSWHRKPIATACAVVLASGCLASMSVTADATPAETERARQTSIKPGTLERGPRPHVLYRQKRTIHDGKRAFKINGPRGLSLVGKGNGGYLTVRYGAYHAHLWQVRPRQKARRLGTVPDAAYNGGDEYTVNSNGSRLAITEPDRSGYDSLWVRKLPSGKQLRFKAVADSSEVADFPGPRVVLGGYDGTFWFAPKANKLTRITKDVAILAEVARNRMVVLGGKDEIRFQLVAFGDPSRVVGEWVRGRPLEFSPNGKRLLTRSGKNRVQVRATKGGRLIRTFHTATKITASARWETNRRVLLTVKGHRVAANVRCTVGGKCERTTRLVKRPGQLGIDWP